MLKSDASLQVLISCLGSQDVKIRFCFQRDDRGAPALIAVLKKRKRLFFLADLRETAGRFHQRAALLEVSPFSRRSAEIPSLNLCAMVEHCSGCGNCLSQSDRLLKFLVSQ